MTFRRTHRLIATGLLALCTGISFQALGQEDRRDRYPVDRFYLETKGASPFRTFLSRFKLGLSVGYGHTFYRHDLEGFSIIKQEGAGPHIFEGPVTAGDSVQGFSNWFNDATPGGLRAGNNDFIANSDTTELRFKGSGHSIPLNVSLHYEFDRYRIGGGFTFEYHTIGAFRSTSFENEIGEFRPGFSNGAFKRYYGMIGAKVYRYYDYVLVVDAQIGAFNLGGQFNKGLIKKGAYFNFGATIERDFSEIFRGFVRPSIEFKNYTLSLPEGGGEIKHSMPALNIQFGVFLSLHPLKRCPVKDCHTQINHVHGGKEYRSRRHPIFKKQNPHYGENYPNLIKYKGKNKKIRNPY